jgi:signal transduction histidine kinase
LEKGIIKKKRSNSNDKLVKKDVNKMDKYYVSFEILIKDSGRGISKENQGKLFLNFSKLADEEGLNKTGTGLGLSICKHLIEKMGGEVKVHSEGIGHGTSFIIKLQAIS